MKLHELQYTEGARKARKRVGRGTSSGTGKTAGRGQKGQNSRSGGGKKPGFEGGQTPLFMRLPKRGFTNFNRTEYAIVNLEQLNTFEAGTEVCPKSLKEAGIIKKELDGIKVLGNGKIDKALTIKAHKFSKSAIAAIEAAGGKTEVI
ncbi:MAG: 50S ribosomal protein L15 [Coprobacillaceae bacterium]